MTRTLAGGGLAAAFVVLLTLGPLGVVALWAERGAGLGPGDWAAIRFTLWQAVLSALFSVALAIPVARALARRSFPGRGLLVLLLGAPFIVPVIVAVLGLLAVFGRTGLVSQGLAALGLEPIGIYGLHGVVLAHVFFNLPLATRLILQGWLTIPAERFRLAATLGMAPGDVFRQLEWPMLRAVVPGIAMLIFLICTTSFAVALTLGGGPRATTIELAIYQAFLFDFDLGKAAVLATIQFVVTGAAAALAAWVAVPAVMGAGLDRPVQRWDAAAGVQRVGDTLWIAFAAVFLLVPLTLIVLRGLPNLIGLPVQVFEAAGRSVVVALASAILVILLALPLAAAAQTLRAKRPIAATALEGVGYLSIAASPLVIGTGLFIVFFPLVDPAALALPVTIAVNAAMSLPFALRAILPELAQVERQFGRTADALGMTGWARLRWLILPRLRRPLGFAAGLAAALSMGDLGVIALFADGDSATLPLQLYRLMAAYRTEDAAGAALLLLALSLALFWAIDRGGRVHAAV
ncbi:MAG: thiamine/thiamine pyrophosphate ABC transporter permease ThiP [Pseudomonadota bacterium]